MRSMHICGQAFAIYCKSAWAVAGVTVLEIVLASTTDFDNLRRHSDEECRTYQSTTAARFLQQNCVT